MSLSSGINKSFRIALDNARAGEQILAQGRFVKIVDASSATVAVQVAITESFEDRYETLKKNGSIYEGSGFKKIYLKNDAQAGAWVRLIVSDGPEDYNVENPSATQVDSIAEPVKTKGGANRTHTAVTVGVAAVQLLAANPNRTGWKITNGGTVPIYLGNSAGVTTADGDLVAAGAATGFDDGDALWAISGTAGQDVRVTEVSG